MLWEIINDYSTLKPSQSFMPLDDNSALHEKHQNFLPIVLPQKLTLITMFYILKCFWFSFSRTIV